MAYFVFNGVKLGCSMGDTESFLEVLDPKGEGFLCGDKAANIKDCKPLINILSFGMCKSLLNPSVNSATQLNYGRLQPMPCIVPNIVVDKWENWAESNMYIRGYPVLLNCATLDCIYNGTITVTENIQEGVNTGALGLGKDVMNDSDFDCESGPGTQYINNKGQLLYQRMDGASGRILIVPDHNIKRLEILLKIAKANGRINDPNYDMLLVGMTGEQYRRFKHPIYSDNWNFRNGYDIGYNEKMDRDKYRRQNDANAAGASVANIMTGDGPDIVGMIDFIRGKEVSDLTSDYLDERAGFEQGIRDKDGGFIDVNNPTTRVTPPALLTI